MTVGWDGQPETDKQVPAKEITREWSDRVRQRIENYLTNMRRPALRRDIRPVIDSIEKQYRATGWLSYRQVDTLRRCCNASQIGHPVGGGGGGPCFGRNAPAGRGKGPVG
jgi:hypothetical protein